ncbi:MAG: hypothetical protein DI542_12885 [Acinetobacter johnsonii]|uniref:Uncharacterized protein n=1 Tax=Acinetobacter johnsonii TaxID=40214 RepID=A0A2W5RE18_ACIJO|nr:MAG: hypothetical protein DI542_12885 [Acinetobacter johnsonii]
MNLKVDLADFLNPTVIANTAQTCGYAMYTERERLSEPTHGQKTRQNRLEIEAIVRWSDFNKILIEGNKTSID